MDRRRFGRGAKLGIFVLLFCFILVPFTSSSLFAEEKAAAAAGGAGASAAGGSGAGAAGAGKAGPGGTKDLEEKKVVGILLGLAALGALIAAGISGDDGEGVTATHSP